MTQMPQTIRDARYLLLRRRPYLAAALLRMQCYPVERLPAAMGVDDGWNLYYNPQLIQNYTAEQLSAVLYHEVWHLLARHHERLRNEPQTIANLAADMAINPILKREGFKLPDGVVLPEQFELPDYKSAEFYMDELRKRSVEIEIEISGDSEQSDGGSDSQSGQQQSGEGSDSQSGDSSGSSRQQQSGQQQSSQQQSGDSGDSSQQQQSSQQQSGQQQSSGGMRIRVRIGKRSVEINADWDGSLSEGSCADGRRRPHEHAEPMEELVRKMVEHEVAKAVQREKSRGDVPEHWLRWAESVLESRIPWQQLLRAVIRGELESAMGRLDYTWSKPNRRAHLTDVILPALRAPIPRVGILIDTSGSMSERELGQALSEVKRALQLLRQVQVYSADADLHTAQRVFSHRQVRLIGGGGTSMRRAVQRIMESKRKPQLLVIVTDGETDWPDRYPGLRIVAAITQPLSKVKVPEHIRAIQIGGD